MNSKSIGLIIGIVLLGGLFVMNFLSTENQHIFPIATSTVATSTATSTPTNTATTSANQPASPKSQPSQGNQDTKSTTVESSQTTPSGYTAAQVAEHNSSTSCWTIVNGNVYDVTSFIKKHPGGSGAIKSMCGKDGSEDFNNQQGGENRPEKTLGTFFIGALIK
jgi:cytochrome b involved in lipid metabolism